MIDSHQHPDNWGIMPIIFDFGGIKVNSYSFFVLLGLCVGLSVYYYLAKKEQKVSESSFFVLMAGLFGGIIGAKLPIWILNYREIIQQFPDLSLILSGRTITGGLMGGTLAVFYIKKRLNITDRKGNIFAPAIAIGVAIGRIGCFLRGCCYGIGTKWGGVDFGDGIYRYPTQIYEAVFMLVMFFFLMWKRKTAKPGQLFYWLMNAYFIFRFFEEFIRESPHYFGITLFQYISIAALIFINVKYWRMEKIK